MPTHLQQGPHAREGDDERQVHDCGGGSGARRLWRRRGSGGSGGGIERAAHRARGASSARRQRSAQRTSIRMLVHLALQEGVLGEVAVAEVELHLSRAPAGCGAIGSGPSRGLPGARSGLQGLSKLYNAPPGPQERPIRQAARSPRPCNPPAPPTCFSTFSLTPAVSRAAMLPERGGADLAASRWTDNDRCSWVHA